MATTYTLISSNTLSSSAASVTFSSIPSTYTDLVLRVSARADGGATARTAELNFNGVTTTTYSDTTMRGSGSAASSLRDTSITTIYLYQFASDGSNTANTFNNAEIYIPSYTISANKPVSNFSAQENNATTAYLVATAGLWRNTSTISSITITGSGANWVTGSSFYLYGVKNS